MDVLVGLQTAVVDGAQLLRLDSSLFGSGISVELLSLLIDGLGLFWCTGLTNLTRLEAKVRCEGALGQLQTLTSLQDYVFASTSGAKPSEMEIRDLSKLAALERIDLSQVGIPYKSLVGLEHTQVSVIVYPHHEKALKSSWRLSLSEFIESSSGIAALPRSVQAALWRGHQEQILRAAGNFRSSV